MPRISEFYGIAIAMYYAEHGLPHFHAIYVENWRRARDGRPLERIAPLP
jgi:hypothetical protein